jgi:hypothetical protein
VGTRQNFTVPGGATFDTSTLYIDDPNNRVGVVNTSPAFTLDVAGIIRGSSGVIGLTTTGAPSASLADGAFAIDTTNHTFYYRSGSTWRQVSSGSSVTVQDAAPTYAANGLWYESDTGKLLIGYDGYWVEVASAGPPGPAGTPVGVSGSIQFNNGGTFGGAGHALIENGFLRLPNAPDPDPLPAVEGVALYGRSVGGRMMLRFCGPSGLSTIAQPHMARNKLSVWSPAGNSTTIVALGAAALTATGTATAANVATTNRHTWMKRLEYLVTTAATTAVAGFRSTVNQFGRGASDGDGGFHFICQWGPATGVATASNRAFVGMSANTNAPTDVQPSTLVDMIGMGWDSADENIQFFHNSSTGTATKVDTGIPVPTEVRTKVYELVMFCPPNSSSVSWEIRDLDEVPSGPAASGTVSTNLPSSTTLLSPRGYMSAGGTSSVIGIALMNLYIETDY